MKIFPVLNALIDKERCSLAIAISKNLFPKIIACYFLIHFSQMTLLIFFRQLSKEKKKTKVKKNKSLLKTLLRTYNLIINNKTRGLNIFNRC